MFYDISCKNCQVEILVLIIISNVPLFAKKGFSKIDLQKVLHFITLDSRSVNYFSLKLTTGVLFNAESYNLQLDNLRYF